MTTFIEDQSNIASRLADRITEMPIDGQTIVLTAFVDTLIESNVDLGSVSLEQAKCILFEAICRSRRGTAAAVEAVGAA